MAPSLRRIDAVKSLGSSSQFRYWSPEEEEEDDDGEKTDSINRLRFLESGK